MARLFFEDCERSPFVTTLEDGTEVSGKILFKAMREDGTEIAEFVQFRSVSNEGKQFKLRSRWLVPSSVTLTDEERSKLTEFMEAGNARLREMLKDQEARWKKAAEKAKSSKAISDIWMEEFAVGWPIIGKPSTRKRKTKNSANKRTKR